MGQAYEVPELVEQHKPAVIMEFDRFCDEYLSEFIAKYKKPGIGRIVAALAKEWKEKRDQEASRHENDTVAQRIAEKEQAFQRERETFNTTLQGKDRDLTNTVTSLTSRLNQAKNEGKKVSADLVKYGNTLNTLMAIPSVRPSAKELSNGVRRITLSPTPFFGQITLTLQGGGLSPILLKTVGGTDFEIVDQGPRHERFLAEIIVSILYIFESCYFS
jgi:hypothetical protein